MYILCIYYGCICETFVYCILFIYTKLTLDFNCDCSLLHTSEIRFKVTLAMAPAQRPRGMLGFWATLITSLGNTDEMPVCLCKQPIVNILLVMLESWLVFWCKLLDLYLQGRELTLLE